MLLVLPLEILDLDGGCTWKVIVIKNEFFVCGGWAIFLFLSALPVWFLKCKIIFP